VSGRLLWDALELLSLVLRKPELARDRHWRANVRQLLKEAQP
jgi:hypothetical protein